MWLALFPRCCTVAAEILRFQPASSPLISFRDRGEVVQRSHRDTACRECRGPCHCSTPISWNTEQTPSPGSASATLPGHGGCYSAVNSFAENNPPSESQYKSMVPSWFGSILAIRPRRAERKAPGTTRTRWPTWNTGIMRHLRLPRGGRGMPVPASTALPGRWNSADNGRNAQWYRWTTRRRRGRTARTGHPSAGT